MNVTLSKNFERQVLIRTERPFLVGNRRVVYNVGRYEVQRATTDEVLAVYNDRGLAVQRAINTSGCK